MQEPQRVKYPKSKNGKPPVCKFKNIERKERHPFVMFGDFEAILPKVNVEENERNKKKKELLKRHEKKKGSKNAEVVNEVRRCGYSRNT